MVMSNDAPHGLDERRIAVDRLAAEDDDRPPVYVLVHRAGGAPTLMVVGRLREGFGCGVHVVPDSGVLFFGCGESVCAYDMASGTKLHQDITPYAFHSWNRHGEVVLMSGELEVAAFALDGTKLWSAVVESPWDYGVNGANMYTLVMGHKVEFPLRDGPGEKKLVDR